MTRSASPSAASSAAASLTRACCAPFESMRTPTTNTRRAFLKTGALIVSFRALDAQGPFDTHASHIDPEKLDAWLAVGADGIITAYTGKCDFGQGIFTAQTQL